jgi:hypothetical protein
MDFIGCAGRVQKFQREGAKSSVEMPANVNGGELATGHANTAKSHERSLPLRKSRHDDQTVSTSAKRQA